MAFFKFIFYLLLFLLIKLGDFVIITLLDTLNAIKSPFITVGNYLKKKINTPKSAEGKSKPKSNKTIRYQDFFQKGAVFLVNFLLFVPREIFSFFYSASMGVYRIVKAILRSLKSAFRFIFLRSKIKKRGRPKAPQKLSFFTKVKYLSIGSLFAFFFLFIPAVFLLFISDLPKLSNLSFNYISKSTKILDRNGVLLFEIYANQNRTIVDLDQIPKDLKNATIAIEDREFYRHSGFDIKGITRAIFIDLVSKERQGGSTITQQLIKSALLTPEPTIKRKIKELVLAFWAEQKYTKDEILELYFNYVPYGGTAWGVEAASQVYFGKHVSDLSLSESAYLAGLTQAPSKYSPFVNYGRDGKMRQKDVLSAMVSEGYISNSQANKAFKEVLNFKSPQVPIQAPHFVMYIKDLLIRKYGLMAVERGGLQVTTSLDLDMQKRAETIVADEVERDGYLGVGNGASLVTDPQNGDILAMVGSRDYFDPEHDGNVNITTSLRQPGSTIKLVTYALALSEGLTEATIIEDQPYTIKNQGSTAYTPVNYDGRYHGKVPIRIALANSFNIPAVKLAHKFGVEKVVDMGKKMGITSWGSPDNYGVSITLGAAEVSMVELATVYGVVANKGQRIDLDPILSVVDSEGKVLQQKKVTPVKVLDEGIAYILADILSDNRARSIAFGINTPLNIIDRKVAVKTGTTDNKRDNWTVGFTPDLLVVTWVGNNDNTPLSPALASGITGAAPMWNKIITSFIPNRSNLLFEQPESVVVKQCYGYQAYFIRGTETNACRYQAPSPTLQQQ